jgi:hypothetical protein
VKEKFDLTPILHKESLEKLYNYINSSGSGGKYYAKALELTNEAQAKP